ncbi:MAG: PhoH family protein [Nitrospiria bacterium]
MKKASPGKVSLKKGTDIFSLYGRYDHHIKLIERAFAVKVAARGEEITIQGNPERIQQAEKVISALSSLVNEGFRLTEEDVGYAIQASRSPSTEGEGDSSLPSAAGSGPLSGPHAYRDAIPAVGKKKSITPKTPAQKEYIESIKKFDVVVGIGPAGTGKTYLAMAMAVSALQRKEVNRIILARPAVEAGERLGFLPGDMYEKINPYLRPLYDALYDMMEVERANRFIERGDIEIAPLAFMRGRTLNDSFVLLDEAQNTTSEQMKMFLTRLGFHSKAVITGDVTQVDLPAERPSGLIEIQGILQEVSGIRFSYFTEKDVIRHRLVQEIIKAYDRYEERVGKGKKK